MSIPPATCINCGSPLTGLFCAHCGEKVISNHDKTIRHFLHEAFHFITHLDGKFLKSLRAIFFKPGLLSLEYCMGIRKKYFKPVSLFLIGVILYLIFPLIQGLNMSHAKTLRSFREDLNLSFPITMSVQKAEREGVTLESLGEKFDAKSAKVAKILLLILLPFTACVLWLLFFRKREYFFDHLILSTELNTQYLYSVFFIIPILLKLAGEFLYLVNGNDFDYNDTQIIPMQVILLSGLWGASLRRFYSLGWWGTIWKTLAFFLFHAVIYVVYRLVLFLVVLTII